MDPRTDEGRHELGRRIQAAVAEAGYTSLPAFAQDLGCSRALIYQYVNGDVLVQLDRLQAIAELTDKPLDWFFSEKLNGCASEFARLQEDVTQARSRVDELEGQLQQERTARVQQLTQQQHELMDSLRQLCLAQRRLGDTSAMLETAVRWRELARTLSDSRAAMDAALQTAHAWYRRGEMKSARQSCEQALEAARTLRDLRAEQSALQELVRILQASGHSDEARAHALHLSEAERWWPRWSALVSLAAIEEQVGELTSAEERLDQAAALAEDPEQPAEYRMMAQTYIASNRNNLALARGDYLDALSQVETLRRLAAQANLPDQSCEATLNAAVALIGLGRMDEARDHLEELARWCEMSEDNRIRALTRVFCSRHALLSGDFVAAKTLARQAMEDADSGGSGQILAEGECALGHAHLAEGRYDDAEYHLNRCICRSRKLEFRRLEVCGMVALARTHIAAGAEGALEDLRHAATVAADTGYADVQAQALAALAQHVPGNEAIDYARQAVASSRRTGFIWGELAGLNALAGTHLVAGELAGAEKILLEASRLKARALPGASPAAWRPERELRDRLCAAYEDAGEPERAAYLDEQMSSCCPGGTEQNATEGK